MSDLKFSVEALELLSYRDLQQLAKSLCLPSNVKKIYLIKLIHAKKYKTAGEVEQIIQKVKLERLHNAQQRRASKKRKYHLQGSEISSTSSSQSPPITTTPKRRGFAVQRSPDTHHSIHKYTRPAMLRPYVKRLYTSPDTSHTKPSDRVLRSFNGKKRRSFKDLLDAAKAQKLPSPNESTFSSQKQMCMVTTSQANVMNKCVVNKHRPNIIQSHGSLASQMRQQVVSTTNSLNVYSKPAKRKRTVSGIYPIATKEASKVTYEYIQSVGIRRSDGKIAKINAVIVKQPKPQQQNVHNAVVTVQDLINSNVDSYNFDFIQEGNNVSSSQYPNMSSVDCEPNYQTDIDDFVSTSYEQYAENQQDTENQQCRSNQFVEDPQYRENRQLVENQQYTENQQDEDNHQYMVNHQYADNQQYTDNQQYSDNQQYTDNQHSSEYYHKKIRSEQVRSRRESLQVCSLPPQKDMRCDEREEGLPKIHDVFSKFSDVRGTDVTQPIYVQVSAESERMFNYPVFIARPNISSTTMLECLYNFKTDFLVSQPLLQIATTTSTRCVYSTPLLTSPMAFTTTVLCTDHCTASSCEQASHLGSTDMEVTPSINDYIPMADQNITRQNCGDENEELAFDQSSQTMETSSIPEMVEDALEIISQDGDYMERVGTDDRIDCVICTWAGPRFLLEYHIRKEHAAKVWQVQNGCYSAAVSLGALLRGRALRRVLAQPHALYLLRARHSAADNLVADLLILSSDLSPKMGQITVYNKLTGEPNTWSGEILPVSADMPYYTESNCFTLPISSLDLLPIDVSMALTKELIKSPGKAVEGMPALDDINIVFHVKIFE